MKIYLTSSIRMNGNEPGDSYTEYMGMSKEDAEKAAYEAWNALSECDQKNSTVEVQEWNISDDVDAEDEDAVYAEMCELGCYDTVCEFSYGFKEQLKELLNESGLSQRAFAEKLGVSLRALEYWLNGGRTPDDFKKEAVLNKAKQIADNK